MRLRIDQEITKLLQAISATSWRRIASSFALYLLPVILFVAIADEVREQDTLAFDKTALTTIHTFANPMLDGFFRLVTNFGSAWWVIGLTIGGAIYLLYRSRRVDAVLLITSVVGSAAMNVVLKALFQRDRPQLWDRIVTENGYSFPSGHAMASASLAIAVVVICWHTRWRWTAIVIGCIYMAVIGLSRLYLDVHYPTDILAGWVVATAWVIIATGIIRHWRLHRK